MAKARFLRLLLAGVAAAIAAQSSRQAGQTAPPPLLEIVPAGLGMRLLHAPTPEKHQIETMPGGVAAIDYDNDGKPDLFFANGAPQPSLTKSGPEWHNRLYRNLGNWKFVDVTGQAGLAGTGYNMAAAAGDFDNDGFTDLFVSGVRTHTLFRNQGDGTFTDVTAKAGLAPPEWSIGAGWFDYDKDGDLDLFVVNYVPWRPEQEIFCGDTQAGYRTYCHPKYYDPLPNQLYRNNGNGAFTDVSRQAGLSALPSKGMAPVFADFDADGWPDVFVTNDTTPNFLLRNRGDGTFEEIGVAAGVGLNEDGLALSSMGADARDLNNDGRPDLFVTALANETFPVYLNLGKRLFKDFTYPSRMGALTLEYSGWSTGVYDFDNDGWKDMFVAAGDVNDNTEVFSSRKSRQPSLLFLSREGKSFAIHEVTPPAQHRGTAFADFDGDGWMDVAVTRLGETPLLLRNAAPRSHHWLRFRLLGRKSNRNGLGAVVHLTAAGRPQWNQATTAVGYLSSSESVVHFGLGASPVAERVEILWPSGARQTLENIKSGQFLTVEEP